MGRGSFIGEKEKRIVYKKCFIPDFSPSLPNKQEASICYLHGNVDEDIYILKTKDYEKYYPSVSKIESHDKSLEDFLKQCYKSKNIIFIGFSFQDYYVRNFFFNLSKEIEQEQKTSADFYRESGKIYTGKEIKHYLLIDEETSRLYIKKIDGEKETNLVHEYFGNYNITVVIYKTGGYIFLEKLFEALSQR